MFLTRSQTLRISSITQNPKLTQKAIDTLKSCYDPEIPVDIWELGLIYELTIDKDNNLTMIMTLTSPSCPVAETLPPETEQKLLEIERFASAKITMTFEPPWEKEVMSEEAKLELEFF